MPVPQSPHPIATTARRALAAALIAVAAPAIGSPISCAHAQPAGFEPLDDDWGVTDADILHWLPTWVGGPVVDGSLELADASGAVVPDVVADVALEAATEIEAEAGAAPAWATSKDGSTDDTGPGLMDAPSSVAASDDAADDAVMIEWGRESWEGLKPYVDKAVYVNALEDILEEGERPVREAYGANYERLRALK